MQYIPNFGASAIEFNQSSAIRADFALRDWYSSAGTPDLANLNWRDYDAMVEAVESSSPDWPAQYSFEYTHPVELQDKKYGLGKPYSVRLNVSDTGGDGVPMVAVGGLINVVQRFDFMALDARCQLRLIGLDLAGRGRSGWLVEQSEYNLDSYVEQLRQLLDFLELERCTLLGSSLGGAVALRFAMQYPKRAERLVLNDSGPFIPVERRARRAVAVGRFYVFRSPEKLFQRTGAATRPVGPVPEAVLLHNFHHKTRWSDVENGRIYRHDPRATLAYRAEATQSLDMWKEWNKLNCPVLLLRGSQSDATSDEMIETMRRYEKLSVIHVHEAGHTPSLASAGLTDAIIKWVQCDESFSEDLDYYFKYNPARLIYPQWLAT